MRRNFFQPKRSSSGRSGFTLVELLVVIVIIASLAAITLTVVRSMKGKAQQATATNVIRQVAVANLSYSLENNSNINLLTADAGNVADSFWGRLAPFIASDIDMENANQAQLKQQISMRLEALFGTTDLADMSKTFQQGVEIFQDAAGLPLPFAFNRYLDPATLGSNPKTSTFRDTSQIVHLCYGYQWADETDAAAYEPLVPSGGTRTSAIDWFESKTAAFVFLDGHLELLPAGVPLRRFTEGAGGTP